MTLHMLLMGILKKQSIKILDASPCSAFRLLSVTPGAPKSMDNSGGSERQFE